MRAMRAAAVRHRRFSRHPPLRFGRLAGAGLPPFSHPASGQYHSHPLSPEYHDYTATSPRASGRPAHHSRADARTGFFPAGCEHLLAPPRNYCSTRLSAQLPAPGHRMVFRRRRVRLLPDTVCVPNRNLRGRGPMNGLSHLPSNTYFAVNPCTRISPPFKF